MGEDVTPIYHLIADAALKDFSILILLPRPWQSPHSIVVVVVPILASVSHNKGHIFKW